MGTNSGRHPAEEKKKQLKTETRSEAEGRNSPAPGPASTTKPPTKVNERANINLQQLSERTPCYQLVCRRQEAQMVSAFSRLFATVCVCSLPPLLFTDFFFFLFVR